MGTIKYYTLIFSDPSEIKLFRKNYILLPVPKNLWGGGGISVNKFCLAERHDFVGY